MKNTKLIVALAAMAATFATAAIAEDIYKWTDTDGNVHYGDRPTGSDNEERLTISYKRTNSASVQKRVQGRQDAASARRDATAAAAEEAKTAAEAAAEAEEQQKRCDTYRAQLEVMVQSRRLYKEDENGERVYLDDTQRQEARDKTENLISENCN